MAKYKLGNWAAMIGMAACWILIAGGIMGLWYPRQYIAIYSICVGGVLYPLLYPIKFLGPLKAIFHQYYVAAALTGGLSVLCYFLLPTVIGGIALDLSAIVFLWAAIRGEKGDYFDKND
ncbi:hypothetical protein DICPUDRAFT_30041 [Dictyostelium purpureum]|uniref:p22-phox n=1 Tax=Dictyostelium purpureum TaxID=5786 RepID=F0ZEK8_DICPU|nr:uncharacterized protein DICPUDRAFT_30041 [Dictyostelium purpureum]EGC37590.1 hypothetical protein DICPUDRAFT_30041 [Dictyostelium purpureum]|eukprot:XP_003285851.1 hypothetical protein DICPUDRAFT_30041 [Dictyostelium purpureum]